MEIQLFREGWGDDKKRERCVDLYWCWWFGEA
jgi:hypothetical protein